MAQRLGACLRPGDTILLKGDIGAGKTHFARCLIQSLQEQPEDVPSPTFTIVQTYETPGFEIWHVDLYRIGGEDGCVELGLIEAFETAVTLIEWPDRLGRLAPEDALTLTFETGRSESERMITASWQAGHWAGVIRKVAV